MAWRGQAIKIEAHICSHAGTQARTHVAVAVDAAVAAAGAEPGAGDVAGLAAVAPLAHGAVGARPRAVADADARLVGARALEDLWGFRVRVGLV